MGPDDDDSRRNYLFHFLRHSDEIYKLGKCVCLGFGTKPQRDHRNGVCSLKEEIFLIVWGHAPTVVVVVVVGGVDVDREFWVGMPTS